MWSRHYSFLSKIKLLKNGRAFKHLLTEGKISRVRQLPPSSGLVPSCGRTLSLELRNKQYGWRAVVEGRASTRAYMK